MQKWTNNDWTTEEEEFLSKIGMIFGIAIDSARTTHSQ